MKAIDRFNKFSKPVHNGQDQLKNLIFDRYPILRTENSEDLEQVYSRNLDVEYVWLVDKNVRIYDSFPWWFRPSPNDPIQIHEFPYVYKESRKIKCWDKVRLVPTKPSDTEPRQHAHIVGEYDVYNGNKKFDTFYLGTNQDDIEYLQSRLDYLQTVTSWQEAKERSYTDMFWIIWDDIDVRDTFKFSYRPDEWSHDNVHVFGNGDIDQLDGVALFPKNYPITEKELTHRFYANKKEIRIMASKPKAYDKFTINNYEDYTNALQNTTTDMFWGVPSDIAVKEDFKFDYYISHHENSLKQKNHVWNNHNKFNGVVLFSTHAPVTEKEINYRFLVDKIEHEEIASTPLPFDKFTINNYEDYSYALASTSTHMFWGIPSDVIRDKDVDMDAYMLEQSTLDTGTTHLFLNREFYDGVALYSKASPVTEKEVTHRFYSNKKEHNVVVSKPKPYKRYEINNYEEYLHALKTSETEMFWSIPSDIVVKKDFDFNLYFSHHNKFDQAINHVFLNDKYYDGIVLYSKQCIASEKEVEHRFLVNKKEWEVVASTPKPFDKFVIKDYDDYLLARSQSKTGMFWMVYDNITIDESFDWNFYITHHNQYERKINHVWRNGEFFDGLALTTKNIMLTKHEIDYRFLAIKKEYEETVSVPDLYDIVFISNGEPNADENYETLLENYPNAKRVDKIKGIHQAHIEAAKLVSTNMFWAVDADAEILDDFELDHQIAYYDIDGRSTVYVWRSLNPVNDLIYGYGGVKLLPTSLTLNMDVNLGPDMTTSISRNFKGINRMSNITAFNTDAFSAWRSGFRECCKLASRAIDRQKEDETTFRLTAWCTRGIDKPFGEDTINGAFEGTKYGLANKNNTTALHKINDFEWLKEKYDSVDGRFSGEFDLSILDKSEEDALIELNPVIRSIFKEIDKKLGRDYKFMNGSVKFVIENLANIYFDSSGVSISDKWADAEIILDLKLVIQIIKGDADTLELYKNGQIVIEGDPSLAREFQDDLEKRGLEDQVGVISAYTFALTDLVTDIQKLDISINIIDHGSIILDSAGIREGKKDDNLNLTLTKEIVDDLLSNKITLIECIQENLIDYPKNSDHANLFLLHDQLYKNIN